MTRPSSSSEFSPRLSFVWLAPLAIFVALTGLALLTWGQEVEHDRRLLARHTKDISVQASMRLKSRLDSRLRAVSIFATRWSTHGERDFSRKRFEEFASVLLKELPAFHAIRLFPPGSDSDWVIPGRAQSACEDFDTRRRRLVEDTRKKGKIMLSAPCQCEIDQACMFAVLPLVRGQEFLGSMVVEFRSETLIGEIFHQRVRSEFNILVEDSEVPLFRFAEDANVAYDDAFMSASQSFPIRNRTWRLTVVPRKEQIASTGWTANIALPVFGIALSIGLSLLVYLLFRRMELYRVARDQALNEMSKREKTQKALQDSEARYRSVFNSASDGLLVIDQDDRIVEANQAAATMHGYEPEGLARLNYKELIAPDCQHLYDEFRRQLARSGTVRLDSVHVTIDGNTLDVEVRGTNFHFGSEPRVLAIVTDVSDRKRAMEQQAMLSRKVLMAQEEERARVSRDLHDELGQILTALHLELEMLRKKVAHKPAESVSAFGNAIAMVEKAAEELRHICKGLRPLLLDDLGISPSLRSLVDEFGERTRIKTDLEIQFDEDREPISAEVALCVYRIVQECLHNISRHANAKKVSVSLIDKENELRVSVHDDGQGYDVDEIKTTKGYGIAGMRERAFLVNGTLNIDSDSSQGTRITFRAPRNYSAKE
jgi:PAS domain S-box-containing protein